MGAPRRFALLQFLEDDDAGAFADDEAVAVLVERAGWRVAGSSLRVDSARIDANRRRSGA